MCLTHVDHVPRKSLETHIARNREEWLMFLDVVLNEWRHVRGIVDTSIKINECDSLSEKPTKTFLERVRVYCFAITLVRAMA